MTVTELIEALIPFKDDDELGAVIVGSSGMHTVVSVESEHGKPVIVIEGEKGVLHD